MKSKRFLLCYEGPIEEFVSTVNAVKVIFHQLKIGDQIHKVGEVYDQNAFNFILGDSHITPYVPCPEAMKQLNKLQAAREKLQAERARQEKITNLKNQIIQENYAIEKKFQEIENLKLKILFLKNEIREIIALIPIIEKRIEELIAKKETKKKSTTTGKKKK